jgi:hypothetical protein
VKDQFGIDKAVILGVARRAEENIGFRLLECESYDGSAWVTFSQPGRLNWVISQT